MKKKILSIVLIMIMLVGTLFALTGCGSDDSSKSSSKSKASIKNELNELMDELEKEGTNFHVSTVQEYLEKNSEDRLLAGSNKEFTEAPSSPKNKYTYVQKSEQLINTNSNYVLIYNTKTEKYYSIPVGAVGYKPYFNEATEIK